MKEDRMEKVAKKTANKSLRMDKKESPRREGANKSERMDRKEDVLRKEATPNKKDGMMKDKHYSKYKKMVK